MVVKVRRIERKEIEVPDLPKQIAQAQKKSGKPVSEICVTVGFSRTYWYQIVNGREEAIAEDTLRKIEELLDVDFGVKFND
ncbi:MAG: helix-turn-helix transcriptional regulator [Nostoc sp.]|uniref:helix-turn-helix domain-containing protein n=1 Tax=Nostoc sp. TaxID=1180 RepID=UPI002FF0F5CA